MVNRPYKVGDNLKTTNVYFTLKDKVEAGLTNTKRKSAGYEPTML